MATFFGFLPQNFGRWWGPTNCPFVQKESSFSGAYGVRWLDTQTRIDSKNKFELLHSPGETFTT